MQFHLQLTDNRPGLVVISNEQTPYRLHFHRRIVREMPEFKLWSVFTHDVASSPWGQKDDGDINPVRFGQGEKSEDQSKISRAMHEWAKGGRIIDWLSRNNIAAVVIGGYNDAGRLRIIRWCKRRGLPCFLFGDSNILGDTTRGWRGPTKKLILPRIVRSCTGVLCCGDLGRRYFLKHGASPTSIFLMPYEPDYSAIQGTSAAAVAAVRARFDLSLGRHHILFVGRLESMKRPDLLLKAFLALANRRPEWDLVFAGTGSLAASLQASVPEALGGRVKWTGFIDSTETLYALYALSDLFVLPSDYEPWGVVVNEASVFLPIIASNAVGAANELVRDGLNGRLFQAGDGDGLSKILCEATDGDQFLAWKRNAPSVLAAWRNKADPIDGLRSALASNQTVPFPVQRPISI